MPDRAPISLTNVRYTIPWRAIWWFFFLADVERSPAETGRRLTSLVGANAMISLENLVIGLLDTSASIQASVAG